jgi:DNA-binding response OmpR family regulator
MTAKILVIDDEPEIRRLLKTCFEREGYSVTEAADAATARASLEREVVSLITLDLSLGQEDGLCFAREIRAKHDVPIIMVSGKGDTVDRIVGLEIGADDYISKPFNLREVLARVRAVLRRREGSNRAALTAPSPQHEFYEFAGWIMDITSRELKDEKGVPRELTTAEFNLLEIFVRRPHRALTRDEIMDLLSGHDYSPLDRSIDALVSRLRRKIDSNVGASAKIKSIRSIGYMFACDVKRIKR